MKSAICALITILIMISWVFISIIFFASCSQPNPKCIWVKKDNYASQALWIFVPVTNGIDSALCFTTPSSLSIEIMGDYQPENEVINNMINAITGKNVMKIPLNVYADYENSSHLIQLEEVSNIDSIVINNSAVQIDRLNALWQNSQHEFILFAYACWERNIFMVYDFDIKLWYAVDVSNDEIIVD